MNERDALFEAIRTEPDDDLPRLVFADWLDEHGDSARAEFIRVQVELTHLDEFDERREGMQAREEELLRAHEADWSRPFQEMMRGRLLPENGRGWQAHPWEYRRGFIDCVEFWGVAEFLTTADQIFRLTPLRHLYTHGNTGWLELARSPHLAKLHTLEVDRGNLNWAALIRLVGENPKADFQSLLLRGVGVGDAELALLARSHCLSHLRCLGLGVDPHGWGRNAIGVTGVRHLALSTCLTHLTHLDLSGNPIGREGVAALASSPNLQHILFLGLGDCGLVGDALRPLLNSTALDRITDIDFSNNSLDAMVAHALCAWPQLKQLRALDLSGNALTDTGTIALATSPDIAGLKCLRLCDNGIGESGAKALANSPYMDGIVSLDLRGNERISEHVRKALKDRFGGRTLVAPR